MRVSRFLVAIAVTAVLVLGALALLPDDRYARFAHASTESPHYLRIRWIYERIHFDRTPIDVAFIGTSHSQSAIDSRIVEEAMRARGQDVHVVNFAVPHLGRDLHWLLGRELLENRTVRELVVEVQDYEPRAPHPAFQRLGSVRDLVTSPVVINTGYLDNLVRLPRREVDLALPGINGTDAPRFVPERYDGAHWDDTAVLHGFTAPRTAAYPEAKLVADAAMLRTQLANNDALARRFAMPDGCSLLLRYNRHYLDALLRLAREKGVHVTFLYLPFFAGPATPPKAAYYDVFGETLTPGAILADPAIWLNVDHLNVHGARRVSRWIGETLPLDPRVATPAAITAVSAPCY